MSSGRTLSYHREDVKAGREAALFVRDSHDGQWLLVGIYGRNHLVNILRTTYAHWPNDCVHTVVLPSKQGSLE